MTLIELSANWPKLLPIMLAAVSVQLSEYVTVEVLVSTSLSPWLTSYPAPKLNWVQPPKENLVLGGGGGGGGGGSDEPAAFKKPVDDLMLGIEANPEAQFW
ncbi:MAG: hypothetical protein M3X11_24365 [Acidobacteriota bacterium]|nr:hypothetical protein [Acidobacteriota bacterium]